jgi:hypothetical protein
MLHVEAVAAHKGMNASLRNGSKSLAHQSSARDRQFPWTIESSAVPEFSNQCCPLDYDVIRSLRPVAQGHCAE